VRLLVHVLPHDWQAERAGCKNKRALGELVSNGSVPGPVGDVGGSPVGWTSLGPGEEANGLLRAANVLPAGTLASPLPARDG
jgi:hypothetical protein